MLRRILLVLAVCSVTAAVAQPAPPAAPLKAPVIAYEKYTLPNGLEVILSEDHRLPLVSVNLWYHVGPVKERAGRTGFAHLFEHMMFEGSKNVGEKSYFKYLEAAGASDINGTTYFDRTNYFETLPANELDMALWLESDRMGFLLDVLDAKKLANQRDVVRNERRQSIENAPYGLVDEAVYHELFPRTHPYYPDVMGSHADVESARLADIRDFFKHFYTPNNCSLVIVGDFQPGEAKKLVEKYFGPLPRGPEVPKVDIATPPITAQKRLTVTDTVQLSKVELAWLSPPIFTAEDAAGDIAVRILGQGKASLLYRALVYDQQIAQSAGCSHTSLALTSPITCEMIARPGVTPEKLEQAADAVIARFRKEGPTARQLEGARNSTLTQMILGLQSGGNVADQLNSYNQYTGDPGYLPKDIARYQAVNAASVKNFADAYLRPESSVVVYGVPGNKVVNDVPRSPDSTDADVKIEPEYSAEFYQSQAWRKTAPQPGPEPKFNLPEPQVFTLANGLEVYFIEQHNLPIFSASLVSRAASEDDPANRPGVASFTNSMLTQGTTRRSATQIAEDAELYGANLSKASASEDSSVGITSLSNNAQPAMDLLADIALDPAFADQEVDRLRKQRLTQLLQLRDEPVQIALRISRRALFGEQNPLGHASLGSEESNQAISKADLAAFYNAHSAPKTSLLVLAGDMDHAQAKSLAEKYFGPWHAAGQAPPEPPAPQQPPRKVLMVDMPGSPQTTMIAIGRGPARSTPDYPALQVMNTMLGGLFSSRLNMDLREEHGYTYGAFSFPEYERTTGMLLAGARVRTDVTAPAVTELYKQLSGIRTQPLSPQELKMSIDSNVRSLPGAFATAESIAATMAGLWVYGLPLDYYKHLPAQIESVSSAQAQQAAEKYVLPENMFLILVGDKAKIEAPVKALNLGPVEMWDTDGKPLAGNIAK